MNELPMHEIEAGPSALEPRGDVTLNMLPVKCAVPVCPFPSPAIFCTARITPKADLTFDYDQSGMMAITLSVADCYDRLVDIVAWGKDPTRWWCRHGEAVLLGAENLDEAEFHRKPVFLHGTPEAWLRSRLKNPDRLDVAVLDWRVDLTSLFRGLTVDCNPRLANALRVAMHRNDPKIRVSHAK